MFPPAHDPPPSTSTGGVELLEVGGEVTDVASGVGSGETAPALGGKVTDGTDGVGSGGRVEVLGRGVTMLICAGAGVVTSPTAVSLVEEPGADVEPGRGDGARVPPYNSSVDRCTPSQLHCSTEEETLSSARAFSSHEN